MALAHVTDRRTSECLAALYGLADYFLYQQLPPNVKHTVHSLKAVLLLEPPRDVEVQTCLLIGNIFLHYTEQFDLACTWLERAITVSTGVDSLVHDRFEAISSFARALQLSGKVQLAFQLLQQAVSGQEAQQTPYWTYRLLFQAAQLALDEGSVETSIQFLQRGADFSGNCRSPFPQILFNLSHGMLLLLSRNFLRVDGVLGQCSTLINLYNGSPRNKEMAKIMFLMLQACHFLYASQVNSAAQPLKQLQDATQAFMSMPLEDDSLVYPLSAAPSVEQFTWLGPDMLCVSVYTITVMYELLSSPERALRASDKALNLIEKCRGEAVGYRHPAGNLLDRFEMVIRENCIQAELLSNRCADTTSGSLSRFVRLLASSQMPHRLTSRFQRRLRYMLACYAGAFGHHDTADWHFQAVAAGSGGSSTSGGQAVELTERELVLMSELNRVILLSNRGRIQDATVILGRVDRVIRSWQVLPPAAVRASYDYAYACCYLAQRRPMEAKDALLRAIEISQADGLLRLGLLCRILIAYILISCFGNASEARSNADYALSIAKTIGDCSMVTMCMRLLCDIWIGIARAATVSGQSPMVAEGASRSCYSEMERLRAVQSADLMRATNFPEHAALLSWPQMAMPLQAQPEISRPQHPTAQHAYLQPQQQATNPAQSMLIRQPPPPPQVFSLPGGGFASPQQLLMYQQQQQQQLVRGSVGGSRPSSSSTWQ